MVRAYSLDLRERVAAALGCGESCRSVGRRFKVSVTNVVKWWRGSGSTEALVKPPGGNIAALLRGPQFAFHPNQRSSGLFTDGFGECRSGQNEILGRRAR